MSTLLVYDPNRSEIGLIRNGLSGISSIGDDFIFRSATTMPEFIRYANELFELSVICVDFETDGEDAIYIAKSKDSSTLPVIIASSYTSPQRYVRPGIMAAGLLLRPLSSEQVFNVFREVLDAVWQKDREKSFGNEVFVFTTREGVIRIPYAQILYFEARNKKIIACTGRAETEFYATLENLLAKIPKYFLRCHKGYIVNKLLVNRADFGQNTLHLTDDFQIPISRSYKAAVKEALM